MLLALSFPLIELPYFLLWVSAGVSHRHVTDLKHTDPWFRWSLVFGYLLSKLSISC